MGGDWLQVQFGQLLAEPVRNGVYKPKEFHGRGVKIVNMGELFAHPRLRSVPMKRVELSDVERDRFDVRKGDLLFARRSLVAEGAGKCSIVLDAVEPTTFESSIIRARPDTSKVDPLFLFYFFNSGAGLHALDTIRRHVAVAGITGSDLVRLEVLLPRLEEQQAIARILGTLDDKIELNRGINETLEGMARAMFKSWFVDFDPVRAKAEGRDRGLPEAITDVFPDRFEDLELGNIPAGWQIRPLYDCAEYINGSAFRNEHFSLDRSGLPVIKIAELKDGVTEQTKFTEATLDTKYRIMSGDILFSWSGSPDTSIDTFIWVGTDGWLNQHIFKISFKRPEEKYFVYYLLRHFKPEFIEIARNKQTTGLGHVTAQDLKRLKTVFPSDRALREFNLLAEPLFQKVYSNDCESRQLTALRDTLLPRLVSGELRVNRQTEGPTVTCDTAEGRAQ